MTAPAGRWLAAGRRKFVVVIYAITWAGVLALLGRLTAEFATVVTVGVTAFAAANAFEHHTRRSGHDRASLPEQER